MINLENKTYYIAGVANKKSVAFHAAKGLIRAGAKCVFSAQNEQNLQKVKELFPESKAFLLDIENNKQLKNLAKNVGEEIDGFLHSMAFANFSEGPKPFHETKLEDFLQACHISSFSLVQMSNELKDLLKKDASVVTISISNTLATSYGYLGPIKAMLETTCAYLAKSFSDFSNIRFNSVAAGPLKTSASAGIPNYIENYLYSEELTLRKKNLSTEEVANAAIFLLSPLSSGINATNMLVDAGMRSNYFDQKIVKGFSKL
ncbi:MAG: SDR family oxidoreductase [Bacteriovoracaceae bacterium]